MGHAADAGDESGFARERRQSWARLLRKVLELDPLLCPQCEVEMKIVWVITDPVVVDAILRHVDEGGGRAWAYGTGCFPTKLAARRKSTRLSVPYAISPPASASSRWPNMMGNPAR